MNLPYLRRILLFIYITVTTIAAKSQSVSKTDGCAPLNVEFKGVAGVKGFWDFGNGNGTDAANGNDGSTNYLKAGAYVAKYKQPGKADVSFAINVYGKPKPTFSADKMIGCAPLDIVFTDASTAGDGSGTISKWAWDFGDGTGGSTKTITHRYNTPGKFSVTIIVTDAHQCDSALTKTDFIVVARPPQAKIVTTPTSPSGCKPPLKVTFDGSTSVSNSPTGTVLTYLWEFPVPAGSISTDAKPEPQTYTTEGVFPVKLRVTDNIGCTSTATVNVTLNNPFASFLVGDTVCKKVHVVNQSTGSLPTYDFGDGSKAIVVHGADTFYTYKNPGTYFIKLKVSSGACTDDTIRKIVVEEPVPNFSWFPSYSCSAPAQFNFTDLSAGNPVTSKLVGWNWTFKNTVFPNQIRPKETSSTLQNPVFTVYDYDTNRYSIFDPVTFDVELIVTTKFGCQAKKSIPVVDTVFLPTARIMPDVREGCAPLTVNFTDKSIAASKSIKNWKYRFGDGTPDVLVNSKQVITHTYSTPGTYWAYLVIENDRGCIDTSYSIRIQVSKKPTPDFSFTPNNVCANTPVNFTDLTPASDMIDTWHYTSDGNMMSGCIGDPNPSWVFGNTVGVQNVTLTVGSKACSASVTKSITIKGPVAQFYSSSNCDTPLDYTFNADVKDAGTAEWTWNFGDNTIITNSKAATINHIYAKTGDYKVILTATDATTGCPPYNDTVLVKVRELKADFVSKKTFCPNEPVTFNASTSVDVYTDHQSTYGYYWLFGDGTSNDILKVSTTTHAYKTPGIKTVRLVVKDVNGCRDTLKRQIKVMSVAADFSSDKIYGCLSQLQPQLTINFKDVTVSDTAIKVWDWDFGDGKKGTIKNPTNIFEYKSPGASQYKVTLIVTDSVGCKDTVVKNIIISKPLTAFTASPKAAICVNDKVTFTASNKNKSYEWNLGDGSPVQTGQILPPHEYTTAGKYPVTLTVIDSINCIAANNIKDYIYVQDYPIPNFTFDTTQLCAPQLLTFKDVSVANVFGSRSWDLGTGAVIQPNVEVVQTYNLPGTYKVKLKITTTNGCAKEITKELVINGASSAEFIASKDKICKGEDITFTIKKTDKVFTYQWDFGDGKVAPAQSPITHKFNIHPPNGKARISLIVWSTDSTCRKAAQTFDVDIHRVIADFKRNNEVAKSDTLHCLNIPDVFTTDSPKPVGADTWAWNFGDGATAGQATTANHVYTTPGTYNVVLNVKSNELGCVDTLRKKMIIYALPAVVTSGGKACVGDPKGVSLQASGGVKYNWEPKDFLVPAAGNISNPVTTTNVTKNYTVTVTDTNECAGTAIVQAYIQQRPPGIIKDTTVIVGQTVPLYLGAGDGFIYSWTPKEFLNCITCKEPISSTLKDKTYSVSIKDTLGCFDAKSIYNIYVKEVATIDVPSVFTPNGDNANDKVYVRGWGLKRLLSFKIYNRFGQVVFETNDLDEGWDGTFQGVPQNMETYVYEVSAETYVDDKPVGKHGYIKLIR